MITGIYIENFKGIGKPGIKLDFAPVTLMFGKNSAGKSTVFHALLFAYEVLVNRNYNADRTTLGGDSVDLGGFHSFVHDHDPKNRVTIRIELDLSSAKLDKIWSIAEYPLGIGENVVDLSTLGTDVWSGSITFTVSWEQSLKTPFVSKYVVELDNERLSTLWCDKPGGKVFSQVNYRHTIFRWPNAKGPIEQSSAGVLDELYTPFQTMTDQRFWRDAIEFGSEIFEEKADISIGNMQILEASEWRDLRMIEEVGDFGTERWFYRYDIDLQKAILEAALFYNPPNSEWKQEMVESEWHKNKDMIDNDWSMGIEVLEQYDALPPFDRPLQLLLALDAKTNEDAPEDEIASLLPSSLSAEVREQIEDRFAKLSSGVAQETRDVIRGLISRLALGPMQVLVNELERFRHIGPLRDIPPRSFRNSLSPDPARWSSGLAGWDFLSLASDEFVEQVSKWLSDTDRFNTGYSLVRKRYKELDTNGWIMRILEQENPLDDLPLALEGLVDLPEMNHLMLRDDQSQVDIDPPDTAVGIIQLVPVLVAALDQHSGVSLIEQPELHNHPAVEVGLGDLFIESIGKENLSCRFLIETHGEHMMLRFLRRIRETSEDELPEGVNSLEPEAVAVYYFERTPTGVTVIRLRIDQTGEFIDRWPHGFFRERGKELF